MDKFTTIAWYICPWDAYIVRGRLESEGIYVFIAHEHHVSANLVYSLALGGVQLRVLSKDAERAEDILHSLKSGEFEAALKQEIPDAEYNQCPACGSMRFKSRFKLSILAFVIAMLAYVGIIFPPRRDVHTCLQCRHRWIY